MSYLESYCGAFAALILEQEPGARVTFGFVEHSKCRRLEARVRSPHIVTVTEVYVADLTEFDGEFSPGEMGRESAYVALVSIRKARGSL